MASDAVIVRDWDRRPPRGGTAVVVDVLRFSTTVCALLAAGRRRVLLARTPAGLRLLPGLGDSDVFSELGFRSPGRRFDNSPHQAFTVRSPRPAAVSTGSGTRAVFAARGADEVLIGGLANFAALLRRLRRCRGAVRLLPASSASPLKEAGRDEDEIVCSALRAALRGGSRRPQAALRAIRARGIPERFRRFRPLCADIDMEFCLAVDRLPLVPRVRFSGRSTASVRRTPA